MADQKITELPIKNASAIQLADYLLGIDAAEGYQMLISDLAKKIIESYSGTSLGGAGITLKAALDNIAGGMATIESSTTASKAYAVGDYLVLNGLLYKVTAAIASGGTITVGTNVLAAAVADDITAINNKIGDTALGTTAQTITGAIAEHEQDISGLNSKLTKNLTLESNVTAVGNNITSCLCVKCGNIVTIYWGVTANTTMAGNSVIAHIPEGYRPLYNIRFTCYKTTGATNCGVNSNGNIICFEGLTSGQAFIGSISYII